MVETWTAVLLAGQRPGADPLAGAFGTTWKALVRIDGEAMLSRVARTLLATPGIARLLILAQEPGALLTGDCAWLAGDPRVSAAVSGAGIAGSVAAVAGGPAAPWPILVTTADHPLLRVDMVGAMLDAASATGCDVAIGVVGRRTLLAAYPDSRRTWLRFADEAYTGANLFALRGPAAQRALSAWSAVERDRKKALALVWHFGPWLALRSLTRTIGLAAAMRIAGRRLGFAACPVILPFAEAGIDVDKPADHALAEHILRTRRAVRTA